MYSLYRLNLQCGFAETFNQDFIVLEFIQMANGIFALQSPDFQLTTQLDFQDLFPIILKQTPHLRERRHVHEAFNNVRMMQRVIVAQLNSISKNTQAMTKLTSALLSDPGPQNNSEKTKMARDALNTVIMRVLSGELSLNMGSVQNGVLGEGQSSVPQSAGHNGINNVINDAILLQIALDLLKSTAGDTQGVSIQMVKEKLNILFGRVLSGELPLSIGAEQSGVVRAQQNSVSQSASSNGINNVISDTMLSQIASGILALDLKEGDPDSHIERINVIKEKLRMILGRHLPDGLSSSIGFVQYLNLGPDLKNLLSLDLNGGHSDANKNMLLGLAVVLSGARFLETLYMQLSRCLKEELNKELDRRFNKKKLSTLGLQLTGNIGQHQIEEIMRLLEDRKSNNFIEADMLKQEYYGVKAVSGGVKFERKAFVLQQKTDIFIETFGFDLSAVKKVKADSDSDRVQLIWEALLNAKHGETPVMSALQLFIFVLKTVSLVSIKKDGQIIFKNHKGPYGRDVIEEIGNFITVNVNPEGICKNEILDFSMFPPGVKRAFEEGARLFHKINSADKKKTYQSNKIKISEKIQIFCRAISQDSGLFAPSSGPTQQNQPFEVLGLMEAALMGVGTGDTGDITAADLANNALVQGIYWVGRDMIHELQEKGIWGGPSIEALASENLAEDYKLFKANIKPDDSTTQKSYVTSEEYNALKEKAYLTEYSRNKEAMPVKENYVVAFLWVIRALQIYDTHYRHTYDEIGNLQSRNAIDRLAQAFYIIYNSTKSSIDGYKVIKSYLFNQRLKYDSIYSRIFYSDLNSAASVSDVQARDFMAQHLGLNVKSMNLENIMAQSKGIMSAYELRGIRNNKDTK